VLFLAAHKDVDLTPPRSQCTNPTFDAEQDYLCYVAEVEAHPTTVWASIFADFVPNDVGLVGKAPRLHDAKGLGEKRIGTPQVQVAFLCRDLPDW